MKQLWTAILLAATLVSSLPVSIWAAPRVVVSRSKIIVRPGHPIRRSVHRTVVVRPPRRVTVTRAPIVFLPPVVWVGSVVSLPKRDRLVWQDSETIRSNEDWVDCSFGVENRGDALLFALEGRAKLDFAEVTFESGQVQVVDFNERSYGNGTYRLLDFVDGRRVDNVRIVAKAETSRARLTVYMRK